jgi:hypothetical protein
VKQQVVLKLSLLYLEICGNSVGDRVRIGLKYILSVRRLEEPSHSFSVEIQGEELKFRCDNNKTRDFWIKVIRYYSDVIKAVQSINKTSMDIHNRKKLDYLKLTNILDFSFNSLKNNKRFFRYLKTTYKQKLEQQNPILMEMDFLKNVQNPIVFFDLAFNFLEDYFMVLNVGKFESKLMVELPEKLELYLYQGFQQLFKENPNLPKLKYKK